MKHLLETLNTPSEANTIIMMTAADLKKLIDDTNAYTRRVVEEMHKPSYFNTADLMKLFKVGRTTIYNWERDGKLPKCIQPEGTDLKLWDQSEVFAWANSGKAGKYIHK